MNKKLKKWLPIIIIGFMVVLTISTLFSKYIWNGLVTRYKTKVFLNKIYKQEQSYKNDTYGGKTPEETYQMFLTALKAKDIELASKYFVLEEQERYKQALQEVDKNGKWDLMMDDLTQMDNAKWEEVAKDYVNLELFDKNNVLMEQITFVLPNNILPPQNIIAEIWKISKF